MSDPYFQMFLLWELLHTDDKFPYSTSSISNPERFPSLLALPSVSFSVLAEAVAEVLKRFSWKNFNLLCDNNPDPTLQAVEVFSSLMLGLIRTKMRELSAFVHFFDSSRPHTYGTVMAESRKHSTGV
jgi:hypothetical protein